MAPEIIRGKSGHGKVKKKKNNKGANAGFGVKIVGYLKDFEWSYIMRKIIFKLMFIFTCISVRGMLKHLTLQML